MTRIPRIRNREDAPEGGQAAYDEIRGSRGEVSGPFSVLLNSPEMSRRAGALGGLHQIRVQSPGGCQGTDDSGDGSGVGLPVRMDLSRAGGSEGGGA